MTSQTLRASARLALVAWLSLALANALAAQQPKKNPVKKAGKYAVELRIPSEGIYAGEEVDIEFRVTDTTQDDPVQGALPVIQAKVTAVATMPAMPSMPKQNPKTHAEGVPGDYGVVCFFPHGGEYQLDLTITPPNDKAFTVSFRVVVEDEGLAGKRKPKPKPFTVEVKSSPATPRVGEPAELAILIRSRETGKPVTDFEIVHEQLMHFLIVSKDLSQFAHEHPELGEGGKFTLKYTFPTGGEYRLFADVAPKGAGSQVLMQPLRVAGDPPKSGILKVTPLPGDTVNGIQVALKTDPKTLPAGRMLPITFTVKDAASGAPITDIEPWLGAMAHLILIHQDGVGFVHSHPDEADPKNGKEGQLTFLSRFPKPGLYRGWLQFQRAGVVQTATFVLAINKAANVSSALTTGE